MCPFAAALLLGVGPSLAATPIAVTVGVLLGGFPTASGHIEPFGPRRAQSPRDPPPLPT